MNADIVIFDLETKRRPGKDHEVAAGKSDCLWSEKAKMGISVGASYCYGDGEYAVYMDDNLPELWQRLAESRLVAGYNILDFDLPLLRAEMENLIRSKPEVWQYPDGVMVALDAQYEGIRKKTYDMYHEAKAAAGAGTYDGGYRVDDVLLATFGQVAMKKGNGAFAPDLHKTGKVGSLVSYCLGDVHRERRIFERCWTGAPLHAMGKDAGKTGFVAAHPLHVLGGDAVLRAQALPYMLDEPYNNLSPAPPHPAVSAAIGARMGEMSDKLQQEQRAGKGEPIPLASDSI